MGRVGLIFHILLLFTSQLAPTGAFFLQFPIASYIFLHKMKGFGMDTEKWKSVLVPIEVYREIKALAKSEGRTISGQLRLMFEIYKKTVDA